MPIFSVLKGLSSIYCLKAVSLCTVKLQAPCALSSFLFLSFMAHMIEAFNLKASMGRNATSYVIVALQRKARHFSILWCFSLECNCCVLHIFCRSTLTHIVVLLVVPIALFVFELCYSSPHSEPHGSMLVSGGRQKQCLPTLHLGVPCKGCVIGRHRRGVVCSHTCIRKKFTGCVIFFFLRHVPGLDT